MMLKNKIELIFLFIILHINMEKVTTMTYKQYFFYIKMLINTNNPIFFTCGVIYEQILATSGKNLMSKT